MVVSTDPEAHTQTGISNGPGDPELESEIWGRNMAFYESSTKHSPVIPNLEDPSQLRVRTYISGLTQHKVPRELFIPSQPMVLSSCFCFLRVWWLHPAALPAGADALCEKPAFFFFFFFNQHRERLKVCGRRPAQSAHCTCVHTRAVTPWNAAPLSFYHLLFVLQPRSVCTLRPSPRRLTM